ncbi:MAG: hypothetical protein V4519_04135 [Patescibacteria group bacterium]
MKKKIVAALMFALVLVPSMASAQDIDPSGFNADGLTSTIMNLTNVLNYAIPFFIALAIVMFIIGVIRVILAKGPEDAKKAREFLVWSIVGVTVILGIFGISRLLISAFGLDPAQLNSSEIPGVQAQPEILD